MRQLFRSTWLPTLLFVACMGIIAARSLGGVWIPIVGVSALVLTPGMWWWLVGRREATSAVKGALSGALIGIAIQVFPLLLWLAWVTLMQVLKKWPSEELGAIGGALGLVLVLAGAAIAAVVGAVIGGVVASLPKRVPRAAH